MDASGVSVLSYRRSKPQGKVRRRVQDLRIPSSYFDFIASRPMLDLSHNESARLAADSLLSRGLQGYHEVLEAEGEVDFLSELEKIYILENGRDGSTGWNICFYMFVFFSFLHSLSCLKTQNRHQIDLLDKKKRKCWLVALPFSLHELYAGFCALLQLILVNLMMMTKSLRAFLLALSLSHDVPWHPQTVSPVWQVWTWAAWKVLHEWEALVEAKT